MLSYRLLVQLIWFFSLSTTSRGDGGVFDAVSWLWGSGTKYQRHPFILKKCPGEQLLSDVSAWSATQRQNSQDFNYSSLLDPYVNNQCAWLQAPYLGHYTGIGHAISVVNYYVKVASQLHLTLFSDFGPTGHHQSAEEVGGYFGYGCLFANSRHPPLDARIIPVTRENLAKTVEAEKRRGTLSCSSRGGSRGSGHTVFDLGYSSRGQPTDCDYQSSRDIIQQIFASSYRYYQRTRDNSHKNRHIINTDTNTSTNTRNISITKTRTSTSSSSSSSIRNPLLPVLVSEAVDRNDLIMVAHVRRGDVLESHVRNQRLVTWSTQELGIRAVLHAVERHMRGEITTTTTTAASTASTTTTTTPSNHSMHHHRHKKLPSATATSAASKSPIPSSTSTTTMPLIRRGNTQHISIFIVTEQAPDHDTILDFQSATQKVVKINVTDNLRDVCHSRTSSHGTTTTTPSCAVHVFTDSELNALQSFSVLCQAHILIATRSGFSHLAAAICPAVRLVMATPFWCPYPTPGTRGITHDALSLSPQVVTLNLEAPAANTTAFTVAQTALWEETWEKMIIGVYAHEKI